MPTDLNLKALAAGMLCKHTLDAGFGQFLTILGWVCWFIGVYFAKVDPNGTSQTCPRCEAHTPKDLSVRIHSCPECGYTTDDVAAAQVVVYRGISAVGHTVDKLPADGGGSGVRLMQEISGAILGSPRHTRSWLASGGCHFQLTGISKPSGFGVGIAIASARSFKMWM